jgi:hypothetical protein
MVTVGVIEKRRGASFPDEVLPAVLIADHAGGEDLDSNLAAESGVFSFVDFTHAARAHFTPIW